MVWAFPAVDEGRCARIRASNVTAEADGNEPSVCRDQLLVSVVGARQRGPATGVEAILAFCLVSGSFPTHASVAELADALGLGPSGLHSPWGFESPRSHRPIRDHT